MKTFDSLGLSEPLLRAVRDAGYTEPTPIQAQAIPALLDGRDVVGIAQTGTGKTAAFTLPTLQHLASETPRRRPIRALVLTPTRELASQIGEAMSTYGAHLRLRHAVIFGGVSQHPQVKALRAGLDALVATPGRLLDLIGQGHVELGQVEFFVLDEADRMLDMGFIHDVRKVLKLLPSKRQNLLFSATMPDSVTKLASGILTDPVRVEVTPQATTVERIDQWVMHVSKGDKPRLLCHVLAQSNVDSAIVFTRTKRGANRLVERLDRDGIQAAAIHGNKSQNARERALNAFKAGKLQVLVATDIAARGIDIDGVSHVINYDLPNEPEVYVHRIGRTGRAGREGQAIALCEPEQLAWLRDIEKLTGEAVPIQAEHQWHQNPPRIAPPPPKQGGGGGRRDHQGGGRRQARPPRNRPRHESAPSPEVHKRRTRRRSTDGAAPWLTDSSLRR